MRKARIDRRTKETKIKLEVNLDGKGDCQIDTPVQFLNHMLELLTKFSCIDLTIKARGDVEVDAHHTTEDIGICLGEGIKMALGKRKGIRRFGFSLLPMDESLSEVALDISGRPYLSFNVKFRKELGEKEEFNFDLFEDFFRALCNNAGITLHINLRYGKSNHHIAESIFKGFALALRDAIRTDPKMRGIPSTKGIL